LGTLDEPSEGLDHFVARRLGKVLAVVGQHAHVGVVGREVELARDQALHVGHVVDATAQLGLGAKVVDADQQRLLVAFARRLWNRQTVVQLHTIGSFRARSTGFTITIYSKIKKR
jgi:hypothetical protein